MANLTLWVIKTGSDEAIITQNAPDPLPPAGTYPEATVPDGMPFSTIMSQISTLQRQLVTLEGQGGPIAAKITMTDQAPAVPMKNNRGGNISLTP